MPPSEFAEHTSQYRGHRRAEDTSQRRVRNILATIRRDDAVADQALREGNCATTAPRLQHAQEEKRIVVILQRQGEVGDDVDDEADYVRWSSACLVAEAGNHHRREALHNLQSSALPNRVMEMGCGAPGRS